MPHLTDLRQGRARHADTIAGASAFFLVTGVGWIAWQMLQGDESTLLQSQFETWLVALATGTTIVAVVSAIFWRGRSVRIGLAVGLGLAAVAVLFGLVIDILTSIS